MSDRVLRFSFKGDRRYVHGTHIFLKLGAWLKENYGSVEDMDIAFHALTDRVLVICDSEPGEGEIVPVTCKFKSACDQERLYLRETSELVSESVSYPEDEIMDAAHYAQDNRSAVLEKSFPYESIELWVSLTKAMHQRAFPDADGKWLFVRAKFPVLPELGTLERHSVALKAKLGHKLTRISVSADDREIGEIFFALAEGK